jgi:RNA polymerase sigma factor (sigma-70 family)
MSSDERLALRAAEGDERAFVEIYQRYHQGIYRFCLATVGNPQDAQDALQNTMVKVLRALPGEKRKIQLKPWLYRIARNESVEVLRRRRDDVQLQNEQAGIAGLAETAETRERLRALLADLEQLPERQRAALLMRELSGLDFAEIGAAFGSSAAVARQTLYEARLSLRQLEAGREMRCADVMRELSDADGRVTRRREIRAHLRDCADCRAFKDGIAKRNADLAALGPLPVAASAGLLHAVLGQAGAPGAGAASGGGALSGAVSAGTGKAIATSAIVKSAATVAVVAVVGVSAAGRGGLIDVPVVGGGEAHVSGQSPAEPHGSTGATGAASADGGDAGAQPQDGGEGGGQGRASGHGTAGVPPEGTSAAPNQSTSDSQSGQNPSGGGYGRSASEGHGRPAQLPDAADHGQQTAAAHKPAGSASPRGQGTSSDGHGKPPPAAAGAPSAKPTPSPKQPHTPPAASQAPVEAAPQEAGGSAEPGARATPPGHGR